jgi:hypothetical protein
MMHLLAIQAKRGANLFIVGELSNHVKVKLLAHLKDCEGQRHWHPDHVGFVPFLMGAVWSIASERAGHRKRNRLVALKSVGDKSRL